MVIYQNVVSDFKIFLKKKTPKMNFFLAYFPRRL